MFVNLLMPVVYGHWFWVCGFCLWSVVGGFGFVGFVDAVVLLVVDGFVGFASGRQLQGLWVLLVVDGRCLCGFC